MPQSGTTGPTTKPQSKDSYITIKEYRVPRGRQNWIVIGWGMLMLIVIPARNVFRPDNTYYAQLGLNEVPELAKWCYRVLSFLSLGTLVVHIGEASVLLAPKLYKHNVAFGSVLWWKWYLAHIVGGMTSPWTLDELVAEEEQRQKMTTNKSL